MSASIIPLQIADFERYMQSDAKMPPIFLSQLQKRAVYRVFVCGYAAAMRRNCFGNTDAGYIADDTGQKGQPFTFDGKLCVQTARYRHAAVNVCLCLRKSTRLYRNHDLCKQK